jgi:hypothetical protein
MALSNFVLAGLAAASLYSVLFAQAAPLTVVEVGAPAVNCVFNADCRITVTDSVGHIALPFLVKQDTAWLQSRTYTGAAGTPGAGLTGYDYRVSLTEAPSSSDCVAGLVLNFGKVTPLPYKDGLADVFVITTGGLGTIGLKSAEQFDDVIVFEFDQYVCAEGGPSIKNTTFFFGLAAATEPMPIKASVFKAGDPPLLEVDARVPKHQLPPSSSSEGG